MPTWAKRFAENVLANLAAAAIAAALLTLWGLAIAWTASRGGDRVELRAWEVAVSVALLLSVTTGMVLTVVAVRRLRRRVDALPGGPAPSPNADLLDRIRELRESLANGPSTPPDLQVAAIYNRLLEEARKRKPDDPLLVELPVARRDPNYGGEWCDVSSNTMETALGQMASALQ
jgi:hypothetical protein